jgi:hypothetical protein
MNSTNYYLGDEEQWATIKPGKHKITREVELSILEAPEGVKRTEVFASRKVSFETETTFLPPVTAGPIVPYLNSCNPQAWVSWFVPVPCDTGKRTPLSRFESIDVVGTPYIGTHAIFWMLGAAIKTRLARRTDRF